MPDPIPSGAKVRLTLAGQTEWPDLAGQIGTAGVTWETMTEVSWADRTTWLRTVWLEVVR
jgi:hypothetical protein